MKNYFFYECVLGIIPSNTPPTPKKENGLESVKSFQPPVFSKREPLKPVITAILCPSTFQRVTFLVFTVSVYRSKVAFCGCLFFVGGSP